MNRFLTRPRSIAPLLSSFLFVAACGGADTPDATADAASMADATPDATADATPATPDQVVFSLFGAVAAGDIDTIKLLVAEDYIQHSPLAADGQAGFLEIVDLLANSSVDTHRVLVDGDQVALHQTYTLPDGQVMVAFDVFRVAGGQVVEHWDAMQPVVAQSETVSGRSMTDGPTTPADLDKTEENRALVTEFADAILTRGEFDRLTEFVSQDMYLQHNPLIADGLDGLGAFIGSLAENDIAFYFTSSPVVVATGDLVLVGSEGVFGPAADAPYAVFYDLFRVEDGLIVEHWDVIPPSPNVEALPHDNGFF